MGESDRDQADWKVILCAGPDGENVQFWKPNLRVIQLLENGRNEWAKRASDSRGRDLFE